MSERAEPGRIVMQLISRLFTTDHACSITSLLSSSPIRARVCVDSSLNITFTYLIYLNRNCIQKKAFDDRSKSISNHKYEICMLIWCLFRWNLSRALLFFHGIRWSAQIGINGLDRHERDFKREENDSQRRNQVFNIFILSMKIKTGYFFL